MAVAAMLDASMGSTLAVSTLPQRMGQGTAWHTVPSMSVAWWGRGAYPVTCYWGARYLRTLRRVSVNYGPWGGGGGGGLRSSILPPIALGMVGIQQAVTLLKLA